MTHLAQLRTLTRMSNDASMSTREVAQLLKTSIPTVTRHARAGELPVTTKAPGSRGAYMFDRAGIEALVAERESA